MNERAVRGKRGEEILAQGRATIAVLEAMNERLARAASDSTPKRRRKAGPAASIAEPTSR